MACAVPQAPAAPQATVSQSRWRARPRVAQLSIAAILRVIRTAEDRRQVAAEISRMPLRVSRAQRACWSLYTCRDVYLSRVRGPGDCARSAVGCSLFFFLVPVSTKKIFDRSNFWSGGRMSYRAR